MLKEINFAENETVRWRRQELGPHQVNELIRIIQSGKLIEPFRIISVKNYTEKERWGMGHKQELVVSSIKTSQTLTITGFWFERVPIFQAV